MTPGSRVIVTGGAGRLGRSVVASLTEAGHDVISVDRESSDRVTVPQIEADLLDRDATSALFVDLAPAAVVHLAAIAVPDALPDALVFDINTRLAWSVLDATLDAGAGSLLVASSPTVIGYGSPSGWSPQYLPLDEAHPVAPWNGYAVSKVAVEQIVQMAVRRHGDRMRFGIFRPCYVIAPEEWAGAPTQQGHTIAARLADPALAAVALFNYVDARDAGDFVGTWLEHAAEIPNGETFFVAAGDSLVEATTRDALRSLVPGTAPSADALPDHAPVFSAEHASRLLGWHAVRTWRTELQRADTTVVNDQKAAHA